MDTDRYFFFSMMISALTHPVTVVLEFFEFFVLFGVEYEILFNNPKFVGYG